MALAEVVAMAGAAEPVVFVNVAGPGHDADFCNKLYGFLQTFLYNTFPFLDRIFYKLSSF